MNHNIIEKNLLNEFQLNGFLNLKFKNNDVYDEFKNTLKSIQDNNIKKDWLLKEKYPGTKDLRPDVVNYDNIFLKILFDNNLKEKINFYTQRNLELAHIQVRVSNEGPSYMPWHRDSYSYSEKSFGNTPPVIKLIYYLPEQNNIPTTKLQIIKSSHVCMLNNISIKNQLAPGFDIFDRDVCLKNLECYDYQNSDLEYVLFDTSCIHNVMKSTKSTRIIYTFCTEYQFYEKFCNSDNENSKIHLGAFDKYRKGSI